MSAPVDVPVLQQVVSRPALPGPDHRRPVLARLVGARSWPGWANLVCVLGVIAVTLSQLHPSLLLAQTTTAGGDTGAHVALPAFLEHDLLPQGRLTGWDPGWYDGFPLYTFYFPLPGLVVVAFNAVFSYDVAFKLVTVLGSVLLPVCAWAFGRLAGLRDPLPACLAAATLPFLFEPSFTIYGGNLLSTLAGEFSFSLSLSIGLLFLGVVCRGLRTGRSPGAGRRAVRRHPALPPHPRPLRRGRGRGVAAARRRPGPRPARRSRVRRARRRFGRRAAVGAVGRVDRPRPHRLVARPLRRLPAVHHQHGLHQGRRLPAPPLPRRRPAGCWSSTPSASWP